jgi:hypothetical protein
MSTIDGGWRGPNIVKSGLVLYLDAGSPNSYYGGTGTVWKDMSGNGNNGTLINGPTFNSANGGSIVFDGVNDYVNLGSNINLTKLSFFCWIKTTGNLGHLIAAYQPSSPFNGWSVGVGFVGIGSLNFWSGGGWKQSFIQCNTNVWMHIAVTFENETVSFYKDGIFSNSTTSTPISSYIGNKFLGARVNDAQSPYIGSISQTLTYNRALSATEVLQNFNATRARFGI